MPPAVDGDGTAWGAVSGRAKLWVPRIVVAGDGCFHCLVLDGVYRRGTEGAPVFVEALAPTEDELHTVLHKIITRTMKLLTRRGLLVEEQGQTYLADNDADSDEARALPGRWS